MIVDDDPVNLAVIAGFLEGASYTVSEATSGEQALTLVEAETPDLILLDVSLPGIDGVETCRRLRRRYGAVTPPVIFLTAHATADDITKGFSAGGVDYIAKPATESETLARILTHLSNRRLVEQLALSNKRKDQVLGMAAHDLRNPLASIGGFAQMLREGVFGLLSAQQVEIVSMVEKESEQMLALVNELLDVATIEAGVLKLKWEPSNLTHLIERSVDLANMNSRRKQTKIGFDYYGEPVVTLLDAGKIRQVLDNLLSNAVKYSPPGSRITVVLSTEGKFHTVAVIDQGPGIPENEGHKLFNEFATLSVKSTAGEKSTGLGLAICRRIVEAHHGEITVQNLQQGGCCFSFTVPTMT